MKSLQQLRTEGMAVAAQCFEIRTDSPALPNWARQRTRTKQVKMIDEHGNIVAHSENANQYVSLADLLARQAKRQARIDNERLEREILARSKQNRLDGHRQRIESESEFDDDLACDVHYGARELAYQEFAKMIGLDSE